jgi:hypothetical protein
VARHHAAGAPRLTPRLQRQNKSVEFHTHLSHVLVLPDASVLPLGESYELVHVVTVKANLLLDELRKTHVQCVEGREKSEWPCTQTTCG